MAIVPASAAVAKNKRRPLLVTADFYRRLDEGRSVVTSQMTVAGNGDGRPFELTCRWPEGGHPKALVLFCHGLGAGGRDYADLSGFWASQGYIVLHPTFPDWVGAVAADEPQMGFRPDAEELRRWTTIPHLRARLYDILHTPAYWLERIRIVGTVMESLDSILASTCGRPPGPLPLAITGHSFGAYTSQLFAGVEIDLPGEGVRSFRDDRFAAAILLSAQGRDQQGLRDGSWDKMTGPVLNVTGTLDGGAKGQDWHWKVEPYELAPAGDKYLAVIDGADHYLGGMTENDPTPASPGQQRAVFLLTLAFLDTYLTRDRRAKDWLEAVGDRIGDCRLVFKHK